MALTPTRQLHFDTFQSSFSTFHGTPFQFLRYSSSIPQKTQSFNANNMNPPGKLKTVSQLKLVRVSLSTSSWFSKWNQPNKENRPKPPQSAFNYRNIDDSGSGGSTMEKIVEKLKKHGYIDGDANEKKERKPERVIEKGSVEDIFYVEEGMLPNSKGGFSKESPLGVEDVFKSKEEVRFPWEKPKKERKEEWTARSKSRTALAELTLPESELRRLKILTYQTKSRVRVKGAGVTQEVVDAIHEKWKTSEIARVKVEGAPALNMRRMHEILERKTGGLVIWRSGTSISLYRGVSYEDPSLQLKKRILKRNEMSSDSLSATTKIIRVPSETSNTKLDVHQSNSHNTAQVEKKNMEMLEEVKYEDEVNKLLDGLGPRYTDWPGLDPLPVDADMLPGVVPGYKPPFRILPYGVRSSLGQKEATSLRRLARVIPPHFALGRSRQLQGLASTMIKLWEKSSIAKIALKRGVQLTTSERMAEDLKKLTGGMLLSRNKDFLVFYRGKNFLSADVTEALAERERLAKSLQDEEEQARLRASALVVHSPETKEKSGTAGTLEETQDADARWGKNLDKKHVEKIKREAEIARHANLVRKLESKLAFAQRKLMKAERALSKVEESLQPSEREPDPESITDEERYMFRKLGLRMKAFLLLGRRGVFDGTVENMHLHWKYRELVKIIFKAKNFEQVKKIALALEAESGGVLVSVDKISKGYAIIVYRGNDYQRPSKLRPGNLLTKRKALARSIEMQRREALLNHVSSLQKKVDKLRYEIEQMESMKDEADEELFGRLDAAYPTDDDDDEDTEEGDEYVEAYHSNDDSSYEDDDEEEEEEEEYDDDDDDNENDDIVSHVHPETSFPHDVQHQESERGTENYDRFPKIFKRNADGEEDIGSSIQNIHPSLEYHVQNQVSKHQFEDDRYEPYLESLGGETDNYIGSRNEMSQEELEVREGHS